MGRKTAKRAKFWALRDLTLRGHPIVSGFGLPSLCSHPSLSWASFPRPPAPDASHCIDQYVEYQGPKNSQMLINMLINCSTDRAINMLVNKRSTVLNSTNSVDQQLIRKLKLNHKS